jgi:hypothetical protein
MNAIVDDPALRRMPRLATSFPHTSPDAAASRAVRKLAHLDRGDTLRVRDGAGVRVIALSGVVWITEEDSVRDVVLLAGESHRIEHDGMTLALAHRAARVVVERPEGVPRPRRVDVVLPNGDCVRRIALGAYGAWSLRAWRAAIGTVLHRYAWRTASPLRRGPIPYY